MSAMEVIRVSGRAPDVADFLREAMLSQRFADVALCCPGGQKFLAHRLVLSAASPYLQEVLLAHSKSSGYCEPITVILAEVEGPELAALLGFVYTGSATVPRPRLESFLRAAEALRIRLPALPPTMRRDSFKLPPEDVKDAKLAAPYLHCEQYPSSWPWRPTPAEYAPETWPESWTESWPEPRELVPPLVPSLVPSLVQPPPQLPSQLPPQSVPQPPPQTTAPWANCPDYPDYPAGEDLTCRENCCKWRLARRQVANQVTASPWSQIVRPHHSPKIQPIVLQSHPEATGQLAEVAVATVPHLEAYRPPMSACCPSPKPAEEAQQRVPSVTANELPPSSDYYAERAIAPLPSPGRPPRPEITHPVSRLCDSLAAETSPPSPPLPPPPPPPPPPQQPQEKGAATRVGGRRFPVLSDANNNEEATENVASRAPASLPGQHEHRCEQCGKSFVTRASLKVHLRTHSGEKPFRCSDCGKQFSQLRNYKYHRSVHEGTREFAATCPECGKYFNDRGYLSSHMKIHRNRKEYACSECGKSFNQRVAYNMHVRIHTGLKPHQCEQCGKAFSRKMLLKQHLRTHSGERPYQCQVCHKAFADRSNMTLHTRLHSGLKPYQCTLCSKAFTKKHHLKTHLNYHTGTKPYSCPNCALRFSQSSNMRTHYKKCALNRPQQQAPAAVTAVAVAAAAASASVSAAEPAPPPAC